MEFCYVNEREHIEIRKYEIKSERFLESALAVGNRDVNEPNQELFGV